MFENTIIKKKDFKIKGIAFIAPLYILNLWNKNRLIV